MKKYKMYSLFGLVTMLYMNVLHADEYAMCFLPIENGNPLRSAFGIGLEEGGGYLFHGNILIKIRGL